MVFKTVDNREKVDIIKHTLEVLKKCPYAEIHIGTDSQNNGDKTTYSTVIAYKYATRGVHYIVNIQKVPKIKDKWERLWKEVEKTIDIANYLVENLSVKIELDFDLNIDEKYFSNKLVQAASGWGTSMGYKINLKPDNQIATKAADYHCRQDFSTN